MSNCDYCGATFAPVRHQKFCSTKCRVYSNRKKKDGGPVDAPVTRNAQTPVTSKPPTLDDAIQIAEAEAARILELAEQVESGEGFSYEAPTKKQQAILKRFKRDHEAFADATRNAFYIAAMEWGREHAMKENEIERKFLSEWNDRLCAKEKKLNELDRDARLGLPHNVTKADVLRLRSFLHSDSHVGCKSEGAAQDVSAVWLPMAQDIADTLKAKAAHAEREAVEKLEGLFKKAEVDGDWYKPQNRLFGQRFGLSRLRVRVHIDTAEKTHREVELLDGQGNYNPITQKAAGEFIKSGQR